MITHDDAPLSTIDPGFERGGGQVVGGKPSYSVDQAAAQITRSGYSHSGFGVTGQPATVTYAFRSSAPSFMPSDTGGFSVFNAAQITAAEQALQSWSDVANLTFVRAGSGTSGSGAYSNNATLLFANYATGASASAAFAYYPYDPSWNSFDSDVWVNSTYGYNTSPALLGYGQTTLVHEIGHALGLSHPGDYNAAPGVTITYAAHATYAEDSRQYTVMSYFSETNTGGFNNYTYASAPLMDDIAAAQRLYGANMSVRTGDTTYGFNATAGRAWFDATAAATPVIFCVWDTGGTDKFDFSGYADNALVDLRATHFSSVGGLVGNVSIAQGVTIENAITGSGNDRLIGNAVSNILEGGSGNDSLEGGARWDTLRGGDGNDTLDGGAGNDTLTGGTARDDFVFSAAGSNGTDRITDFVHAIDRLVFKGSDYGFSAGYKLTAAQFIAGSTAVGTGAQFVWDAATGHLYWDADGNGSGARVDLALFDGVPGLTKEDLIFTSSHPAAGRFASELEQPHTRWLFDPVIGQVELYRLQGGQITRAIRG